MKRHALCLLLCGAGLVSQSLGDEFQQIAEKWAVRFDLGGNIPDDPSLRTYDVDFGGDSMELSAGGQFDISLGYRPVPWLILEGEMGVSFNEIDSVGTWSYPDSSLTQMSFMANVVFELPMGRLVPYAGMGAGGVFSSLSFGSYYYYYYSSSDGYGTDFVPAAQVFTGLRYQISDRSTLGVNYRFLVTDQQKWDVDWWYGPNFTVGVDSVAIHSICLVYSFNF